MADVNPLQALLLKELPPILAGITATKYLSAAGFVVLLYDHLLLLEEEVQLIWAAKWSWLKVLFFYNRYTVPIFMAICTYVLSGISTEGLSTQFCRDWVASALFFSVTSLAIANVFVIQRVWALWGGKRTILVACSAMLVLTYAGTFIAVGIAVTDLLPDVSYNSLIHSCAVSKRQPLIITAFALPLIFETFLFFLLCWHSIQQRPGYLHTKLVQQLYLDGFVYFFALTALRALNIIVIGVAPLQYMLLGSFFIWAVITALINRMLITISSNVDVPPESLGQSHTQDPNLTYDGHSQNYAKVPVSATTAGCEPRSPQTFIELQPMEPKGKETDRSPGPSPQHFTRDGYTELPDHRQGVSSGPYAQPSSHDRRKERKPSMIQNFIDMDDDVEVASSRTGWRGGPSIDSSQKTYWE